MRYVASMEDVLDLYAEAPDPETTGSLLRREPDPAHRRGAPADPGRAETDRALRLEYRCNGTANLFVFLDVNRPWRKVKVTERRAAEDFASCMRELTDVHYPRMPAG
jgi:hypothetical protein